MTLKNDAHSRYLSRTSTKNLIAKKLMIMKMGNIRGEELRNWKN